MTSGSAQTNLSPAAALQPGTDAAAEALNAAEILVYQGRFFDAIDLLTDANRRARDDAIEHRLVRLRHDAFAFVDTTPGRPSWPPEFDDVFAGVDGIPEVSRADLTAETLGAGILHHGSLLVRGLLGPTAVERLVEGIDRALDLCDRGMNGAPIEETKPWYMPFNPGLGYNLGWGRRFVLDGGGLWTVDSPHVMFDLIEMYEAVGLDAVLTDYLGERPALSVKKCTLRRVPVTSGSDWHQDGAFLGDGIRTVNVWLTLTHCGDIAPGLDVVAKRMPSVLETGTDGAKFDWSVGPGVVERVADGKVVRPVFEAGDALLFDDFNLHSTAVTPEMTEPRYAIESWFFAPSTYPHSQVPVYF
jgi:hypothetical protein